MKQRTGTGRLVRQVLVVDSGLAEGTSVAARSVRALVAELKPAASMSARRCRARTDCAAVSDPAFIASCSTGRRAQRRQLHEQATDLLRAVRATQRQSADLPAGEPQARGHGQRRSRDAGRRVHLDPRRHGGVHRRTRASGDRALPRGAAAAVTRRRSPATTASANTRGRRPAIRAASRSSSRPIGRVFFDFYGENLFRTDMGIERGALGSLLGHTGPIGESERYIARVFGAHRSYSVLNGTSASNRAIMSACVGDDEIALCDRNCHKSIEQGLAISGGIPVFLSPTRNRYGIIGPIPPERLSPRRSRKCIADNPLAQGRRRQARGLLGADELHLRRHVLRRRRAQGRLARASTASISMRRGTATRGSIRCTATATRCAAIPAQHPERRADGVRDAFDAQAARRAVADLLHPHSRRPRRHRSRPLQRSLLLAGEHFAALRAHRVERCRGRDDGRPGGHSRSRRRRSTRRSRAGSRSRARASEFRSEEGMVLRALECREGDATRKRQAHSVPRSTGGVARDGSELLGAASRTRAGMASKTCRTAGACSTRSSSASSAPA